MTPNLEKLINFYANIGWYGGSRPQNLITVSLLGGFESFSGKASETREHQRVLRCERVETTGFTYLEMNFEAKPGRSLDNLDVISLQALQEAERHLSLYKNFKKDDLTNKKDTMTVYS